MARNIKSTTHKIFESAIHEKFRPFKVVIVPHKAIMQKTIAEIYQNLRTYTATHTPETYHHGLAEIAILFPIAGILFERFLLIDRKNYEPSSITRDIKAKGDDYASAVMTMNLATTKSGTSAAADVANSLLLSPNMNLKQDASQILKDFVYTALTSKVERQKILKKLKNTYQMPAPGVTSEAAVQALAAFVQLGKGTVLPPQQIPYYQCLRSMVLIGIGELIDYAVTNQSLEAYSDVLSLISLFATYVNITESENNYSNTFPVIPATLQLLVVQSRRIKAFQTMSMIYELCSYNGRGFNGDFTSEFLSEIFGVFPTIADINLYQTGSIDQSGAMTVSMGELSYLKEVSHRKDEAAKIFNNILPPMFKGYTKSVIQQFKAHASADFLLTEMFDDLVNADGQPVFKDMTAEFLGSIGGADGVEEVVVNPDDKSTLPKFYRTTVGLKDIQTFMLKNVIPAVEALYASASALQASYNNIFADLGTPSGGMVPGLQIQLGLEDKGPELVSLAKLSDMTNYQYPGISKQFLFPMTMPGFIIDENMNQIWSLSFMKHKIVRPDLVALRFARDQKFPLIPENYSIDYHKKGSFKDKWVWRPQSMPTPSYMQNASYSFTPVPFNYVQDFSSERIKNKANAVDQALTRTGKYFKLGHLKFSEMITQMITSGATVQEDQALSSAGLGFYYVQEADNTWRLVNPETPTIYGMPYVLFKHANEVSVPDLLKSVNGVTFLKDAKEAPDVDRVMYDASNRSFGVGDAVFVLHKYIPVPRKLQYILGSLRNGFSISQPYLAPIFSVLLDAAVSQMNLIFKNDKITDEINKALKGEAAIPMVGIAEALNKVISVFFTQPVFNGGKSADDYYKSMLATKFKQDLDEFINSNFEEVMGWSSYIVSYPHLSMSDRYVDSDAKAFNSVLRGYTSNLYIDNNDLHSQEKINFLSVTPDNLQVIDADDEEYFMKSVAEAPLVVETAFVKAVHSTGSNATSDEEMTVLNDISKVKSNMEGYKLQGDKQGKNTPMGDVPGSEVVETIKALDKVIDTQEKVVKKTNVSKDPDDTVLNLDNSQVKTTSELGTVTKKETNKEIASQIDLDKGMTAENQKNIGTGDFESEEQEIALETEKIMSDEKLSDSEKNEAVAEVTQKIKDKWANKVKNDKDKPEDK